MALRTRDHDPPPLPWRLQHTRQRRLLLGREAGRRVGHSSRFSGLCDEGHGSVWCFCCAGRRWMGKAAHDPDGAAALWILSRAYIIA
jgi:hypothetical protein